MNRAKQLGHRTDENEIKANGENVEAIKKLSPTENTKGPKSFLGAR